MFYTGVSDNCTLFSHIIGGMYYVRVIGCMYYVRERHLEVTAIK